MKHGVNMGSLFRPQQILLLVRPWQEKESYSGDVWN